MVLIRIGLIGVMALTSASDASPEALQLFRDGRELMKAGDLEAACDRFARSQALAPKVGTLLNLGDCYEKRGRTASAWSAFSEAKALATQTGDTRRAAEAVQRIAAIEPDLAYGIFLVDASIVGLEVRRNDVIVAPASWNTAVPLDPGEYEVQATAPGRRPWSSRVAIVARQRATVKVSLTIDPDAKIDTRGFDPSDVLVHTLALGIVAGANTLAHPLFGVRVVGNLPIPNSVIRGVGAVTYSFYEDSGDTMAMPPEPKRGVDTIIVSLGIEYVRIPIPQLAFAIGAGIAMEIDHDVLGTDVSGALAVRGSPVIVRLARGRVEVGLHAQFVIAFDELRLDVLAGLDWFVR